MPALKLADNYAIIRERSHFDIRLNSRGMEIKKSMLEKTCDSQAHALERYSRDVKIRTGGNIASPTPWGDCRLLMKYAWMYFISSLRTDKKYIGANYVPERGSHV